MHKPHHLSNILIHASHLIALVMKGRSLSSLIEEQRPQIPAEEMSAVQHLCYHVLRELGSLQAIIDSLAKRPPTKPLLIALLAAACYRLRSRPEFAYATIDQAVEAAKKLNLPSGFVNGLLRNYLRHQAEIDQFIKNSDDPEIRWNFPGWWLYYLQEAYPNQWQEIVSQSNQHPPMTLRVNQRKTTVSDYLLTLQKSGILAKQIGLSAVHLEQPVNVWDLPGFGEGLVSIQDAGAQQAAERLSPQDGEHILDACCAPGGKTGHLLELADISLVGLDIDQQRVNKVINNLDRLGLNDEARVTLQVADCLNVPEWFDGRLFDRILLDAPCSGSGVVRRHPDGKWLKQPTDLEHLVKIQQSMLQTLWPLLKPGGKLLYATCSLFPVENEEQIARFMPTQTDIIPIVLNGEQDGRLLPNSDHDGFYYALLQRRDSN